MRRIVLLSFLFALASTTAFADDVPGPPGSDVTVYVPKTWKTRSRVSGNDALVVALAPSEEAGLIYAVVESGNVDAAMKGIDRIVSRAVRNLKIDRSGPIDVNGMPARIFQGFGIAVDDHTKPVTVSIVVLQPNDTHVLFAVSLAETARRGAYLTEFERALAGIRRVR